MVTRVEGAGTLHSISYRGSLLLVILLPVIVFILPVPSHFTFLCLKYILLWANVDVLVHVIEFRLWLVSACYVIVGTLNVYSASQLIFNVSFGGGGGKEFTHQRLLS